MPRNNRYNMILFPILLMLAMTLLLACSQSITPSSSEESTASPTEGDPTPMTPTLPVPQDANVEKLIQKTKEDLANRLTVAADEISFIEVTEVEWSDSSLDCPQPGMGYLQVITPGYRILLEAGGQSYEYHTNRDTYFVYCENNTPPSLPKP